MISQTNVPIMQKAVNVIYDMSEDTKIREIARLREKALHDEASALKNVRLVFVYVEANVPISAFLRVLFFQSF